MLFADLGPRALAEIESRRAIESSFGHVNSVKEGLNPNDGSKGTPNFNEEIPGIAQAQPIISFKHLYDDAEIPTQKNLLSPTHKDSNLLHNPNPVIFNFNDHVIEKPKHCYDLSMLPPVERYIEHLKNPCSVKATNYDLAWALEHINAACRENASKTAANSDVMQDMMKDRKYEAEELIEGLDNKVMSRKRSTEEHLDILENREYFNAMNILRHDRELNGIYQAFKMNDEEIKNWKDSLKSDDLQKHELVNILYDLDKKGKYDCGINEDIFGRIIGLENSIAASSREMQIIKDLVDRVDHRFTDSIEKVKQEVEIKSKECPGAKIISKIDGMHDNIIQIDTKQRGLSNDLLNVKQRLGNVENKRIEPNELPIEVKDGMQSIYDELVKTKNSNSMLEEKVKVLEASQAQMGMAIGQLMEKVNCQDFKVNNPNADGVNCVSQMNIQIPASNDMQLENNNQYMNVSQGFTGFNQQMNGGMSN